jgi:predicted ABC-type transport system involved in lysophospholipase L1 biosynthesis ATPase subunit
VHNRLVQINRDLGITIVVVTHNPALASRMTRRVLLVDGKLFENR